MDLEDDEGETRRVTCLRCGHVGVDESDGFYYCQDCGARAEDVLLTGVAEEDLYDNTGGGGGGVYSARFSRRLAPRPSFQQSDHQPSSQAWLRFTQEEDEKNGSNNFRSDSVRVKREEESYKNDYYGYGDVLGPTEPEDFGPGAGVGVGGGLVYEDYYNEIRFRYVMGLQWMIQLQCEALVGEFGVSPLVCGVAGTMWLRFVAARAVFRDGWADDVLLQSESQSIEEVEEQKMNKKFRGEPHNALGQRAVMVWFRSLRQTIPLYCTLAISFLACHVVREAILPTDIVKWALEGKLPYYAVHVEIEKRFGRSSAACPISSSLMFRPLKGVPVQKLESSAACIAESIGLHLPPVNFYAIASRFLSQLSISIEKILPQACRIYEWSMPPDLWLSTNDSRLPTRVCTMSILIVAIRIIYNINGFGIWERSLYGDNSTASNSHQKFGPESISNHGEESDCEIESGFTPDGNYNKDRKSTGFGSHVRSMDMESAELLCNLDARYNEIFDTYDYAKDLPSYIQYCKDVVFAGRGPSDWDNRDEHELIERCWEFFQNAKEFEPAVQSGYENISNANLKRSREEGHFKSCSSKKKTGEGYEEASMTDMRKEQFEQSSPQSVDEDLFSQNSVDQNQEQNKNKKARQGDEISTKSLANESIRRLKLDMEENLFCYIPPRIKLKRLDYLHYVRKKDDGALTYVAHADYYVLLRACARVAQIDVRNMHRGVLSLEKRLAWLEKRIDYCLHLTPPSITCEFCGDEPDNHTDDPVGLSNLSL